MAFSSLGTGIHSGITPVSTPERAGRRAPALWGVCERPDQREELGPRGHGEVAGVCGDARALHRRHLQEIRVSKSDEGAEAAAARRSGSVVHPLHFIA